MLNIYKQRDVLYHVVYAKVDAEGEALNIDIENTRIMWFSLTAYIHGGIP